MSAPIKHLPAAVEIDPRAVVFASWVRVIESAPAHNKLRCFALMARIAAGDLAARRQQYVDDLWFVAEGIGLVKTFGVNSVQAALAAGFVGDLR